MRVAVIGAGPSGLVTLKYLLAAQEALGTDAVEVRLFESEAGVGGTFLSRTYEDAEVCSRWAPLVLLNSELAFLYSPLLLTSDLPPN